MKFLGLLNLAALASAVPTPTVQEAGKTLGKRAAITDAANIGYATENGGTTGGAGGSTTTVSSLAEFSKAAESDEKQVIYVKGKITGNNKIRVGSDKTIVGATGASLENIGLYINKQKNVIVRNLAIKDVVAANGDAIGIQKSTNVWVDHCELSSDLSKDKDYFDGLLDVTHASDWVTVSNTYLHDHHKASLVGHSDNNGDEDTGALHVTYANNHWASIGSRAPSVRFGTVHVFNNYYEDISVTGVNSRMGAEVLVESSAFENAKKALISKDSKQTGSISVNDVNLGGSTNDAPKGSISKADIPYKYSLVGSSKVKSAVVGVAGSTLKL
ncbi:pectate lyase B [Fusarium heterosporum]|uniref:pectate lyase n=1 Tax=Fusarium heterosporum TaxID=42747 RepID=A0A8H5TUA5_FUSHE|nr:pectate lyase B [Fusarium heterosporum]